MVPKKEGNLILQMQFKLKMMKDFECPGLKMFFYTCVQKVLKYLITVIYAIQGVSLGFDIK